MAQVLELVAEHWHDAFEVIQTIAFLVIAARR